MQDQRHDEEGHRKNLSGSEALIKLKKLAEDARICMFTTYAQSQPMPTRPMALQEADESGVLYFFSAASSNKNKELGTDSGVQLSFSNNTDSEYLTVYGHATISQDRKKIHELWNDYVKVWFQNGPDDPDLTLIKIQPEEAFYWDTKHNKAIRFLKMAASMATGKTMDDSIEGSLEV